jgi:hypothetical protein
MRFRERALQSGWIALIIAGIILVLVGFFSTWIDHPAAGLALTGFEIGEWIKFAPEVRAGTAGLNRAGFYWPASAAALALAMVAATAGPHRRLRWALLVGAAGVALLPFPLVEEVSTLAGVKANWARFGLIGLGLATVAAIAIWGGRIPFRIRAATLVAMGLAGLIGVGTTFAAAEPIVERLYNRLIDPGIGLSVVQAGHVALATGGLWQLMIGQRKKAIPIRDRPLRSSRG